MNSIENYYKKLNSFSDKIAIIFENEKYSYTNLVININFEFKSILKLGIAEGSTVYIIGDYSLKSISIFFALALNKNIIVPVTTDIEEELLQRTNVIKPDWIINLYNNKIDINNQNKEDTKHYLIDDVISRGVPGLILFSSGSTGSPKAMIHDLDKLFKTFFDKKQKSLNFLVFLMFDHIGGINTLLNCLAMGATLTIPSERNPEYICKLIQNTKVNILPASPTFLNLIIIGGSFERYDLSSLLLITYGTETMPSSLLFKLKMLFPKVKFLQTFGTSETGIAKTSSLSSTSTYLKIDDPDQEYKIVNGELWLKSKTQILGYINHSNESFTSDGWFKTGDLVEEGSEGYIKVVGRTKEIINVGGEKVMPAEVESIILELPWVKDCIVKGQHNAITGQMVVAEICILSDQNPLEVKKLIRKYCQQKLDSYKVPAKVNVIDEIQFTNRFKKIRF
jgi:acyl-coenzyme A synthetase/AMP-(fatty) acid ligase